MTAGDFNGDGYRDLAVGVPGEDFGAIDAGAVNVLYGSADRLSSVMDQVWTEDSEGIGAGLRREMAWEIHSGRKLKIAAFVRAFEYQLNVPVRNGSMRHSKAPLPDRFTMTDASMFLYHTHRLGPSGSGNRGRSPLMATLTNTSVALLPETAACIPARASTHCLRSTRSRR